MNFSIDPAVFQLFPNVMIGVLSCRNISNGPSPAEVTALLRSTEENIRKHFSDPELLKSHPSIVAWQEVHRAFASNPNKFPPSIQALAKRVIKGGQLPAINTLVDLYNVVSLQYMLPVGGEDLDTCSGDIRLTFADGTELFVPLGEEGNDPPAKGEVIYRDDIGVICRRFNWREAARTCLTEKTRNAVLVSNVCRRPTERPWKKRLVHCGSW